MIISHRNLRLKKFEINRTITKCLNLLYKLTVTDEWTEPNYRKASLLKIATSND